MIDSPLIEPFIGGLMIGLSAVILAWCLGKILGVAGILKRGILSPYFTWEHTFLLSIVIGVGIGGYNSPESFANSISHPIVSVIGGLLVGIGVTLANGCTSGHGICGIARFSRRSILATIIFMISGIIGANIILLITR